MNRAQSSGNISADAAVCAFPCGLASVILIADGTNAATLILYDNASAASGRVLARLSVAALATQANVEFKFPVDALNGIYADITGTGAVAVVHYING